nr:hypothetical protein [Tanacetum cinerariifolium]
MPILHSFEENKLEYEDEDEVKIMMMGTRMDKESLEHNLNEDDITLIIRHNFSPTLNPSIKPNDSSNFWKKVVKPLTIHTLPSPHTTYFHQSGIFKERKKFFTNPGDGVRINPDDVARPATGKFNF